MDFQQQPQPVGPAAAHATEDARAAFITKTYLHLVGAIFAFVGLEAFLFVSGIADRIILLFISGPLAGRLGWGIVLAGFIGVSWIADRWARSDAGQPMQYAGLALYVVAEAFIFVPLLYMAMVAAGGTMELIQEAGLITLTLFGGLTGVVFLTRKDFSFMGAALRFMGFGAMALIAGSLVFGFELGTIFSFAMVAFACLYILYHTSAIMLHYRTDQHVAASLALFADVALLLWYVLRILIDRR